MTFDKQSNARRTAVIEVESSF